MKTKYKYIIAISLFVLITIYFGYKTFNSYKDFEINEVVVETTEINIPETIYARFFYFDTISQTGHFELQVDEQIPFLRGTINEVYIMNGTEVITQVQEVDSEVVIDEDQVEEYGVEEILAFELQTYVPYFDHMLFKIGNNDYVVYIGPSYFEERELTPSEYDTDQFVILPETEEDIALYGGKPFYRIPSQYEFEFLVPSTVSKISSSYFLQKEQISNLDLSVDIDYLIHDEFQVDINAMEAQGVNIIAYEKIGVLTDISSGLKEVTSKDKVYFRP